MSLIWTFDALQTLCEHPSEPVREWAVSRALELYPDACGRLATLLPSASEPMAVRILRGLMEGNASVSQPEPLLDLINGPARDTVKRLAGSLLLRSGHSLPQSDLESLGLGEYASIVALEDPSFEGVLQKYRAGAGRSRMFLKAVASVCCFRDLFSYMIEARNGKEIVEVIEDVGESWGCHVPRVKRLSQSTEALSLLEEALAMPVPEDGAPWKRGLLAELERDRAQLASLHLTARSGLRNWSMEDGKFAQACIMCLCRNKACADRISEASSAAQLWNAIVMRPWVDDPDEALREALLSAPPEELLSALSAALSQHYSYAADAFSLLNALDIPGRFDLFLDALDGERDDLATDAETALNEAGAPAADHIIESYPRLSPQLRTLVLFILDALPTPEVVDFCLERFDDYMRDPDSREFIAFLEVIGSDRFLPPLLQEWREGEADIGRTIELISTIHGIKDERIEGVASDTQALKQRPGDFLEKGIPWFPLRCTACGRTFSYELRDIYVDKECEPVLDDIIQCKGCGSIETYEMTAHTRLAMIAELTRLETIAKTQGAKAGAIETPIKPYSRFTLQVLGREVRNKSEGYHLLKSEIEKNPEDADLQLRMGNVFKNGGKPELALPYYLEAIRLDPAAVLSHYSLAHIYLLQEKYREAIPHLEAAVPLCRASEMDEALRRDLFGSLFEMVGLVQDRTGHKVQLFPVATPEDLARGPDTATLDLRSLDPANGEDFEDMYHLFRYGRIRPAGFRRDRREVSVQGAPVTRSVAKVGRNDPCPCGSGKKYKKCCGR